MITYQKVKVQANSYFLVVTTNEGQTLFSRELTSEEAQRTNMILHALFEQASPGYYIEGFWVPAISATEKDLEFLLKVDCKIPYLAIRNFEVLHVSGNIYML